MNRVQKVLEVANIKLASLASDVMGVSGQTMLVAIVERNTIPGLMADLAKGTMQLTLRKCFLWVAMGYLLECRKLPKNCLDNLFFK